MFSLRREQLEMGLVWCVLGVASTCKSTDVGGLLWGQTSGGAWQSSPEGGLGPGGCRLPAEAGRHRASLRHRQAASQPPDRRPHGHSPGSA